MCRLTLCKNWRHQELSQQLAYYSLRAKATPEKMQRANSTDVLHCELTAARAALLRTAGAVLKRYFIFSPAEVQNLLKDFGAAEQEALGARNNRAAGRERHLLLYLQRVAAKNDTFSEFGPSAWGKVQKTNVLEFSPGHSINRREVFFERWTAHALAAALNADPAVRAEIAPRVHPCGRVEDNDFVSLESGEKIALDHETKTTSQPL